MLELTESISQLHYLLSKSILSMTHTFDNWQYRQYSPVTTPSPEWKLSRPGLCTEIFTDLLYNNEISNPLVDCIEKDVQWVGLQEWEYKSLFTVTKKSEEFRHQKLKIHGLDTFATVYINDNEVLQADNMFRTYLIDVKKENLNFGAENTLRIVFKSSVLEGRALEEKYGKLSCSNGETSRVYVRKGQYQYGWDWGPRLPSCGPYRPIEFIQTQDYLDAEIKVEVDEDLKAHVEVSASVFMDDHQMISVRCFSPSGKVYAATKRFAKNGVVSLLWVCDGDELWYPHGYGKQNLYDFEITAGTQTVVKKVGFRRVELVQERFNKDSSAESFEEVAENQETFKKDSTTELFVEVVNPDVKQTLDGSPIGNTTGSSFFFKINNIPIYVSGSNWIPAHAHEAHLSKQDYSKWLQLARDGNQNMLRVWGGGVYEHDVFYADCDRLGIMVWQDFMFACGQYPGHDEFVKNVAQEAKDQVKRLAEHCSVVVFAGNNEDYQIAEGLGWKPGLDDSIFPARKIYEEILPAIVEKYTNIPYHFGSPWGGKSSNNPTVGDIHQWNVWHGTQVKYQDWDKLGGRFISEFGMEALPSMCTFLQCVTDEKELYPQSEVLDHHNKATGFESRLAKYVMENIQVKSLDLKSWIYATQLMQAECLGSAFRIWRRGWKADKQRYIGGALVWQLNDCWGTTSWSIIDFNRRPKLAYYAVKRESLPVMVGIQRNQKKLDDGHSVPPHDYSPVEYSIDTWAANNTTEEINATLKVDLYDLVADTKESLPDISVAIAANGCTEIISHRVISKNLVVHCQIVSGSSILSSSSDWPQPLKYLQFPNRKLVTTIVGDNITLSTNKPIKGVEIQVEGDGMLDDNGFDLFPGEKKVVKVIVGVSGKVQVKFYN